jgi:hypothetical protein
MISDLEISVFLPFINSLFNKAFGLDPKALLLVLYYGFI